MEKEDFLQIFKSGFHKLTLRKLKKIRDEVNEHGRKYGVYLGLFEFIPPEQVWMDESDFDYEFLQSLLDEFGKETSNCVTHKFTRKVTKGDEVVSKTVTTYIFDIIPKNIVSFRFDRKKKMMRLVVKGYCMEKTA